MRTFSTAIVTAAAILALAVPAGAQKSIGGATGGKRIGSPLAGLEGDANLDQPVTVSAQFTAATAERPAVLMITAQIVPGYHVYSLTQPAGGPTKTKIEVTPSPQYKLIGQFHGTPEPTKVGKVESHGCVRMTNWDALAVAGMVRKGTPVVFIE